MSDNYDFEEDKKKLLDEQEFDLKADKDSSRVLLVPEELNTNGVERISFSNKYLYVDYNGHFVHADLYRDSISKTLESFENLVDGTFESSLKKNIKLFIAEVWDQKINDKNTRATNDNNNGKDSNTENQKGKATKAELVIPYIKSHIHLLFIDEYHVPHAGIKVENHVEVRTTRL